MAVEESDVEDLLAIVTEETPDRQRHRLASDSHVLVCLFPFQKRKDMTSAFQKCIAGYPFLPLENVIPVFKYAEDCEAQLSGLFALCVAQATLPSHLLHLMFTISLDVLLSASVVGCLNTLYVVGCLNTLYVRVQASRYRQHRHNR